MEENKVNIEVVSIDDLVQVRAPFTQVGGLRRGCGIAA